MTTIAWDGKTLAADQCSWSGGTRRRTKKVFKIRTKQGRVLLVAFAGTQSFCLQVLAWMKGDGPRPNPSDYWGRDDIDRQCAVVIDEKRRVWSLSNDLFWNQMKERKFANGSGQEMAWGALEAGATAAQAIRIVMKRSDYAGLGVDTVSFDE